MGTFEVAVRSPFHHTYRLEHPASLLLVATTFPRDLQPLLLRLCHSPSPPPPPGAPTWCRYSSSGRTYTMTGWAGPACGSDTQWGGAGRHERARVWAWGKRGVCCAQCAVHGIKEASWGQS